MKNIENRLEKLEIVLNKEDDPGELLNTMTPEERQRRIAELLYKGLFDTDPRVMKMTEEEFITRYLSSSPEERHALCGYKESISNDELLDRLRSQMQYEESR